jgi:hypothetical protein
MDKSYRGQDLTRLMATLSQWRNESSSIYISREYNHGVAMFVKHVPI